MNAFTRAQIDGRIETGRPKNHSSLNSAMPYDRNADLPENLQRILPDHAQDIYREAFNHAYAAHAEESRQEEAAHRIAWAAVKRSYVKTSAGWRNRENMR